jgi:murein DD-endopeptidase MepM/ murein hydrolase activator NlpD
VSARVVLQPPPQAGVLGPRARRIRTPRAAALVAALAALAALAATSHAAPFDADSAREKARALTPFVSRGEDAPLWREFDGNMRAALKDSANFAAVLRQIVASTGTLDSVLSEEVTTPQAGLFRYRAACRFAKSQVPLELIFAFDTNGRVAGLLVRPRTDAARKEYPSAFLDYQVKTPLRLPVRGEWLVFWGGRTLAQNYHAITRDQRFAMDILMVKDGATHSGEGRGCSDYYCYGQPVLAPAAGTVVWARDSLPDQVPGVQDPAHATGNSLVIDHGNGEFSLIAHLQPGSLRFGVGDRVPADAVVGRCGNSGNTTEPHVHYHLQNGPRPFDADGLPLQFVDVVVDGKRVAREEPVKGERISRQP